jgi:hypothetical protein
LRAYPGPFSLFKVPFSSCSAFEPPCSAASEPDRNISGTRAIESNPLYEIITERYERGSLIMTSNRAFKEWAEVFNNDLLASAALDRLTHHTHTLTIRGDSFRQRYHKKEPLSTPA